jgi:formylglycine-generating enzyme required for sulfatase activity
MARMATFIGLAGSLLMVTPQAIAAEPACTGIEVQISGIGRCFRPGQSFRDCDVCPEMVVLPPGAYMMGSVDAEAGRTPEEGPRHRVEIAYAFAVAKFEATFAEWDACVAEGGCRHVPRDPGWGRGRRPVINVSWNDIVGQYLPWLSRRTGQAYRLLSEAEWEYAARAGMDGPFSTGISISTMDANFDGTAAYGGGVKGDYRKRTLESGSFTPNAFGLHDMHGNVWEWVQDCHATSYDNAPADGAPAAGAEGCQRVMRGGSWIDSARVLRSAARGHVPADTRFIYRGFRVARKI